MADYSQQMQNIMVGALVYGALASIPALIFAAFWFNDGNLLFWIAVPVIFFMAG